MAGESSSKKPRTMTTAERFEAQREEKENIKWNYLDKLLQQHDQLAQAVIDAAHEEGLAGTSDTQVLSPHK